jgi:hypothetical protein
MDALLKRIMSKSRARQEAGPIPFDSFRSGRSEKFAAPRGGPRGAAGPA